MQIPENAYIARNLLRDVACGIRRGRADRAQFPTPRLSRGRPFCRGVVAIFNFPGVPFFAMVWFLGRYPEEAIIATSGCKSTILEGTSGIEAYVAHRTPRGPDGLFDSRATCRFKINNLY